MGIKLTASYALNMDALNFSNLLYGTPTIRTGTTYELSYSSGVRDVFKGTGFKYDQYDTPKAGTVKSLTEYYGSSKYFSVEGLNIAATSIVNAAFTSSLADDAALIVKAMKGNDTITGSNQDDFLFAAQGNDVIKARGGNDIILSGPGADDMYGGGGADIFAFIHKAHSTTASSGRDTIFDFTAADTIDLSYIDANSKASGGQSFKFIGKDGFHGKAGELRYVKKSSDTYIYGDTNGDKKADIAIHLDDALTLKAGDFIL